MATREKIAQSWALAELLRAAEEIDVIESALSSGAASPLTCQVLIGTAERLRSLADGAGSAIEVQL
jgi:hypothetical protein